MDRVGSQNGNIIRDTLQLIVQVQVKSTKYKAYTKETRGVYVQGSRGGGRNQPPLLLD